MLTADMPGVSHDDLKVTIEEGVLTFGTFSETDTNAGADTDADTDAATEDAGAYAKRVIRSERRVGDYSRTVRLADDVDESAVQAALKDGVLTLTLPKAPKAQPRKIDVFVS